jgi:glucoamylase
VKLQRSAADGTIFDRIDTAYDRYVAGNGQRHAREVWKDNRQVPAAPAGTLLRIQASAPFLLHWTSDAWQHATDTRSRATGVGIEFVDIVLPRLHAPLRFTFLWVEEHRWEGKDYEVAIQARADTQVSREAYGQHARNVA